MQIKSVIRILGLLLMLFSLAIIPPIIVSIIYQDNETWSFFYALILILVSGLFLWLPSMQAKTDMKLRDGFIIVVLFWFVLSTFASLPMILSESLDISITNAIFESVSGLTTTGATILKDIDSLPESILFYRQYLQWLGGLGIIVLAVAVLPMLGVGGMHLYKAEVAGPIKNKITPRITETAKALWYVYLSMTIACASFYKYFGMGWFDAICHSFSTISIGGFSTHDSSFGYFDNDSLQWVAVVFMLVSGINFALHYVAWSKKRLFHYFYDTEVKVYFSLIGMVFFLTFLALFRDPLYSNINIAAESAFQAVSIATTTGFLTSDYSSWPLYVPFLLLCAAFIGSCAGSTGGGIKVIRAVILFRQGTGEITKLIHPNAVVSIKLGKKPLNSRVAESVWGFFSIYVLAFLFLLMLMLSQNNDFLTSFSAVGATLNNLGPGLGEVSKNYSEINDLSKLSLCFAMLLGRLEIFTLLVVFTPAFWKN